jgi:hypothetical protein
VKRHCGHIARAAIVRDFGYAQTVAGVPGVPEGESDLAIKVVFFYSASFALLCCYVLRLREIDNSVDLMVPTKESQAS